MFLSGENDSTLFISLSKIVNTGPRVLKPGFGAERWDYLPHYMEGVLVNSLGVSTLQAADPPYIVNNGPNKMNL